MGEEDWVEMEVTEKKPLLFDLFISSFHVHELWSFWNNGYTGPVSFFSVMSFLNDGITAQRIDGISR